MPETPQPSAATIIAVQKSEIDRLSDGRVYLLALLEDVSKQAQDEIKRLREEIAKLKETSADERGQAD